MVRRKVIAASARLLAAAERRDSNKVRFVRRLLLRRRVHVPEFGLECFRGTKVYITRACKVAGCKVAVVKGCGRCYDAELAFARVADGGDAVFKCRESRDPKLWITTKRLGKVPGHYAVEHLVQTLYGVPVTNSMDQVLQDLTLRAAQINRPTR